MSTAFCQPQSELNLGTDPGRAATTRPSDRAANGSNRSLVLFVILLHGLFLYSMLHQSQPDSVVVSPVLQGTLVQQTAAVKPEPVTERTSPTTFEQSESSREAEPVHHSLPVQSEGKLAAIAEQNPAPLPEDNPTEPVPKTPTEQVQTVVAEPADPKSTESRSAVSAPVTAPRADARHLNNPAPSYPSLSRRLREEGTVLLQLLIAADGSIHELEVVQSSGYSRLDSAALQAVKRWRFEPARQGDTPIAYRYQQPITFQLQ